MTADGQDHLRFEIDGKRGRCLKLTLYDGGFTVDVGIVNPVYGPKARAAITLDLDAVRHLEALFGELGDVMERNHLAWAAAREVA